MAEDFFSSFSRGLDAGQKLGDTWNNASMRRELKKVNGLDQTQISEYTPEQIAALNGIAGPKDGETWSEEDQAYKTADGGLRYATDVPTYENGGYKLANGTQVAPSNRFSLGNTTQDTEFTPEQIAQEKLNRKADIYSNYGKEDQAEQMRNNAATRGLQAQQLKLSQAQLDDANIKLGYAQNESKLFKIRHDLSTGKISEDEAMTALVDATDPMHKDGLTHGVKKLADGTWEVTQMKNNHVVGSQQGVTFDHAFREALDYANPTNLKAAEERDYKKARDTVTDSHSDREFGLNLSKAEAEVKHWNDVLKQAQDQFTQGHINAKELEGIKNQHALALQHQADLHADKRYQNAYDKPTILGVNKSGDIVYQSGEMGAFTMDAKGVKTRVTSGDGLHTVGKEPINTKAEEAFYKWQVENPDAKPDAITKMKRNLGLISPINYNVDPFADSKNTEVQQPPAIEPERYGFKGGVYAHPTGDPLTLPKAMPGNIVNGIYMPDTAPTGFNPK